MSFPQDVGDMDRPTSAGGAIKRAGLPGEDFSPFARRMAKEDEPQRRQQQQQVAQVPVPRPVGGDSNAGQSRIPRPQAPPGLQTKDGQIGVSISRPTQIPQWPLAGPLGPPPKASEVEPHRPPPGWSQPPQRP